VEKDHVPIERLNEIVTHDDVMFTIGELKHIERCVTCFNEWAELIKKVQQSDLTE